MNRAYTSSYQLLCKLWSKRMIPNESLNVVCLVFITTRHIATKETLPEPGNEPIENERIQFPM